MTDIGAGRTQTQPTSQSSLASRTSGLERRATIVSDVIGIVGCSAFCFTPGHTARLRTDLSPFPGALWLCRLLRRGAHRHGVPERSARGAQHRPARRGRAWLGPAAARRRARQPCSHLRHVWRVRPLQGVPPTAQHLPVGLRPRRSEDHIVDRWFKGICRPVTPAGMRSTPGSGLPQAPRRTGSHEALSSRSHGKCTRVAQEAHQYSIQYGCLVVAILHQIGHRFAANEAGWCMLKGSIPRPSSIT